jgi:glycosyltransferase involved in cell wall biosynthesis
MIQKLKGKKVVFLFTPGPLGGAEKIVLYGVKALLDVGTNVELWIIKEERVPHVAEKFIDLVQKTGINPKVFSSFNIFDRNLLRSLKTNFKDLNPAVIHAHGFKAVFYGKLAAPQSSQLVITHHGKTSHLFKVKVYEYIEDQIMKRASAVIAVSHDMKRTLVKAGINESKTRVVENFMTSNSLDKVPSVSEQVRLLFVGRLSPEKGCSILIDAMKNLDQLKFHLTILGDGVEREALEKKVIEQGLSNNISFTGFRQNVNEYMALCDAVVMPSFLEGQPLTLIEACCMGLPVVGSNLGGIPELITENINGYLVPAGNSFELSQALNKLLLNLKILQKTAEDLKADYVARFSSEAWASKTIAVYEMVLSHS